MGAVLDTITHLCQVPPGTILRDEVKKAENQRRLVVVESREHVVEKQALALPAADVTCLESQNKRIDELACLK
jgi:hypothetical protein